MKRALVLQISARQKAENLHAEELQRRLDLEQEAALLIAHRKARRATIRANARVRTANGILDDHVREIAKDALGEVRQDRSAPLYVELFPTRPAEIIALSLEREIPELERIVTVLARDTTPAPLRKAWQKRLVDDVTELESSTSTGVSASVTFPADGMSVTGKNNMDFSETTKSTSAVKFILLDWERTGEAQHVGEAKLSAEALEKLKSDPAHFRDIYGDYFVYQVSYRTKFTAIWCGDPFERPSVETANVASGNRKCTSSSTSTSARC